MPDNDLVSDNWAQEARTSVEAAIERWNALRLRCAKLVSPIAVVWGHADVDDAKIAREIAEEQKGEFPDGVTCSFQNGCLFSGTGDKICDVHIKWGSSSPKVHFDLEFGGYYHVKTIREVNELISDCRTLGVFPMLYREGKGLSVFGISLQVASKWLCSQSIDEAIFQLLQAGEVFGGPPRDDGES